MPMTKHERTLEFLIVCVELKAERIILLGIIAACNGYVKKKKKMQSYKDLGAHVT